ncbi:MAG: RraA family protein [Desulfovibrio sp.]|jgi:regulator of RNase E activity RraA|nr:RraA family protein [Desulfovibrio sp.]
MTKNSLVAEFAKLDTPSVSDALDKLGLRGGLLGIKPVVSGTSFCGRAFTIHYTACGAVAGTVGDFLDDVAPGEVVAIDNSGRDYCTVWGDLMTITARRNGVAGTVIDGVCRDVPVIRELKYPIFTKGAYMVTGKDRVFVDSVNSPVSISGLQVKKGDILLGDDSGALVVSWEHAEKVLEAAAEIAARESQIEKALDSGASLKDARSQAGYHRLQSGKK